MADPMTPEQHAEIRARLDATTTGPWTVRDLYVIAPGNVHIGDFEWLADTDGQWEEFKANVVFAAAARQDVPALLDAVERLRAERDEARTEFGRRVAPVEMVALRRERDEVIAENKRLFDQGDQARATAHGLGRDYRQAVAERAEARAEAEQLRGLLGDARVQCESAQARAEELLSQRDVLRAELAAARSELAEARGASE